MKSLRLHQVFKAVLESFRQAQEGSLLANISLMLGENNSKTVNLKVPLFFIIGDMQGGDKICCTTTSYGHTLNRPCRKCNVQGSSLKDPNVSCQKMSMVKIKKMIVGEELEELKKIDQKNVYSIFFKLCYGGCKFGIFSAACPVEPLHSLESGIMKYILDILMNEKLKAAGSSVLDSIVQKLVELPRQQFASSGGVIEYPRLLWKNGISNLKDLEAKY